MSDPTEDPRIVDLYYRNTPRREITAREAAYNKGVEDAARRLGTTPPQSEPSEPGSLRAALTAFGKRLAVGGYGWEAIITREGPTGEETVAHLTTANPDPTALSTEGVTR